MTVSRTTQGKLFLDDFSKDLSKWGAAIEEQATTWQIEAEELSAEHALAGFSIKPTLNTYSDLVIVAKAKLIVVGDNKQVGVAARVTDTSNFYVFRIIYADAPSVYRVDITKRVAGTYTLLASYAFTASAGVWYKLKFFLNGSALKAWKDGADLISVTDTSHASGYAGCWIANNSPHDHWDDYGICSSNTLRVAGLTSGNFVELYDLSDVVQGSATADTGGVADIDCGGLWFPHVGYLKIWEDATKANLIERYPATGNETDFWGGDVWTYTKPVSFSMASLTPSGWQGRG